MVHLSIVVFILLLQPTLQLLLVCVFIPILPMLVHRPWPECTLVLFLFIYNTPVDVFKPVLYWLTPQSVAYCAQQLRWAISHMYHTLCRVDMYLLVSLSLDSCHARAISILGDWTGRTVRPSSVFPWLVSTAWVL